MPLSRRDFLATSTAVLGATAAGAADPPTPRRLVMLAGSPSHGPGAHEFNAGVLLLAKCLAGVKGLTTTVARNGYPQDDSALDGADAILCYADGGAGHPLIRGRRLQRVGALMGKGVGLMCCHYAVEVPKDLGGSEFKKWIGGYYETNYSCNPFWKPEYRAFPDHPITRGVKPFAVRDEWYFNMRFRDDMTGVTPILSAKPPDAVRDGPYAAPRGPYRHIQAAKGRTEHMMWAAERSDGGRGVGFTGGHTHRNWLDPNLRKVVLNALLWVSKVEVPAGGVDSRVTEEDIGRNLDPKPGRK
ncbi:MAG TPA: ThuA domain-containing protein [Fimbriiglobus sp.]|nr:ThuA domain-containing protein [Fimbriiglobus sp.]